LAGHNAVVLAIDGETGEELGRANPRNYTVYDPVFYDNRLYFFETANFPYAADNEIPTRRLLALDAESMEVVDVGEGFSGTVLTSPAVDERMIFFGCLDGLFHALDLEDWSEKWHYRTAAPIRSSASIAEDLIYFGSDDGFLYVLDKASGDRVRRLSTEPNNPIKTAPAISDGVVYFGDTGGNLYAWGQPGPRCFINSVREI
jgi:outer membrane protein assembly factor BamB